MEYQKQWEFLKGKFQAGQLGHAYLFSGPEGIGKKEFSKTFIKSINCQYHKSDGRQNISTGKNACGECVSCKLIEKESFPDLLVVKSINSDSSIKNEKDMMEIDVDQIRQANNFLNLKSYYGNYKTVIIENAERMNTQAQNSFLKTLEEPKGKTLIVLLSSKPEMLLSTIFSRCQTIPFFPLKKREESPAEQKVLQELLPVLNGELALKFQYAKKVNLEGDNFHIILKVLLQYFRDILFSKLGVKSGQAASHNYSVEEIAHIIKLIGTLHKQILTSNASPKLALEVLLLEL